MQYLIEFVNVSEDWLTTCQIDDPGFDDCSRKSIQGLFKQLSIGEYAWSKLQMLSAFALWPSAPHFNRYWGFHRDRNDRPNEVEPNQDLPGWRSR